MAGVAEPVTMVGMLDSGVRVPPGTGGAVRLPAGLRSRIDQFHDVRVKQTWGGQYITRGRPLQPDSIVLTSNDYLALARDPRIITAMTECLAATGNGLLLAAVLLHGDHPLLRLEADLAEHLHSPGGILCQSGWDANIGLLQTIADATTPVYIDLIAHMSLWQGARTAGAPIHPFLHNDVTHLLRKIDDYGPGVIALDSVYSTNGSVCPIADFCAAAEATGSVLVVDESHSLGTHGPHGDGLVAELGLTDRVPFRTASLSKAFAGRAGYIACCTPEFVDYFKYESYPAIFSSTLLPHDVAGLAETLRVIRTDDWRRTRLRAIAAHLRDELSALGYDLDGSASQIISLRTGPDRHAIKIRDLLESRGVFGAVFFPPAIPRRRTLIRFSLHAGLTDAEVEHIVEACRDIRDEFTIPSQRRET